jgi:hypothetical protein
MRKKRREKQLNISTVSGVFSKCGENTSDVRRHLVMRKANTSHEDYPTYS